MFPVKEVAEPCATGPRCRRRSRRGRTRRGRSRAGAGDRRPSALPWRDRIRRRDARRSNGTSRHQSAQSPMNEPFPPGFFDRADDERRRALLLVAAPRDPHRRRRDRRGRRALRRARARRRRARPHELVGVALPARARAPHGARHEPGGARPPTRRRRRRVVHDLNAEPELPFADASFDAVVCCVSVDYLIRPVEVFRDVARVLRPGRAVRVHVLESLLPDQGDPRLAATRPTSSTARSWPSTSDGPAASRSPSSSAGPPPAIAATLSSRSGVGR